MRKLGGFLILTFLFAGLLSACEPSGGRPVWLSDAEIDALPMSGAGWQQVVSAANSFNGGQAVLDNQDSNHDVLTMGAALYAERTNNESKRNQVCSTVATLPNARTGRILALGRQLSSYAIATDIAGCPVNTSWWRSILDRTGEGHGGGDTLREVSDLSNNNWGTMSRGSFAAVAVLLDDEALIAQATNDHLEWLGENVENNINWSDTNWHASSDKAGVNRRGATIQGRNVDGVIPEDQRRTGNFSWPAPKGSYPWGALSGAVVAGEVLENAGLAWNRGDDALNRAGRWLYTVNQNPADGDDCPVTYLLADHDSGTPRCSTSTAKNFGFTAWTHG